MTEPVSEDHQDQILAHISDIKEGALGKLGFLFEETLSIHYDVGLGCFIVYGRRWENLFTRDEFLTLCDGIANEYSTDELIEAVKVASQKDKERDELLNTTREDVKYPGYVYVLQGGTYYKIGLTANPDARLKQIQLKLPFDVELVHMIKVNDMAEAERYLHQRFASKRANGEWFLLDESDLSWIKSWSGNVN